MVHKQYAFDPKLHTQGNYKDSKQCHWRQHFRSALADVVDPCDPRPRLEDLGPIGEGSTGVVSLMRDLPKNIYVAVKKMNIFEQQRRELLFNEVMIMRHYRHPNIVEMYSSHLIANELWVIMEYLEGGALTNIVSRTLEDPSTFAHLGMRRP
ncbi:unnamed protein product [Dicrocoelium dendriticum]|nr:unnamed protein product [Dicrocoelium dendriticum]